MEIHLQRVHFPLLFVSLLECILFSLVRIIAIHEKWAIPTMEISWNPYFVKLLYIHFLGIGLSISSHPYEANLIISMHIHLVLRWDFLSSYFISCDMLLYISCQANIWVFATSWPNKQIQKRLTTCHVVGNTYYGVVGPCGGHTNDYHFHRSFSCLYSASGGHSTHLGEKRCGDSMSALTPSWYETGYIYIYCFCCHVFCRIRGIA